MSVREKNPDGVILFETEKPLVQSRRSRWRVQMRLGLIQAAQANSNANEILMSQRAHDQTEAMTMAEPALLC